MTSLYRIIGYLICALVAVQAAFHAWGSAGMGEWIAGGGVLDKAVFEGILAGGTPPFGEVSGLMLHGMNGRFVIPVVTLALIAAAFVAKLPGAAGRALAVGALVVLQVALGLGGHGTPLLGLLHGLNALALFAVAWSAARLPVAAPAALTGTTYLNFLDGDRPDATARVLAAYAAPEWERLGDIKTTYDPTNASRRNRNIPPRGPAAATSTASANGACS